MIYPKEIAKEEVALLPKVVFEGKIHMVRSQSDLNQVLPILLTEKILGFDTETKPSFKRGEINGIALLQLSTAQHAVLIKLKEVGITTELRQLLENPSIIKVGAAIRDDIKSMQKVLKFSPQGFIDLQAIVPRYGIECLSVRNMAAIVLGHKVSKSQQLSNWDLPVYTEAMQQYAAIDAWVCREIYIKLTTEEKK